MPNNLDFLLSTDYISYYSGFKIRVSISLVVRNDIKICIFIPQCGSVGLALILKYFNMFLMELLMYYLIC